MELENTNLYQIKINLEKTYPEVYLPKEIIAISDDLPILPKVPEKPQPLKRPIQPEKSTTSYGCIFTMLVAGIVLSIINFSYGFVDGFELIIVFIALILLSIFLVCISIWDKDGYNDKMRQYQIEIQNFSQKEKEQKQIFVKYEEQMRLFEKKKRLILSEYNVLAHRQEKLKHFMSQIFLTPIEVQDGETIKKGVSESFFLNFLNMLDDFDVYTEHKVPISYSNDKYYYPDFVLKHKKTGLFIDLEIDEPYSGETGTPIHYLEENYFESIDTNRNDFFTRNQWIVIRLAEQQVFQFPKLCIQLIKDVIIVVQSLNLQNIHAPKQFEVKKWTKEEAYSFAYKRFRYSYIPQIYHQKIQIEDYKAVASNKNDYEHNKPSPDNCDCMLNEDFYF